MHSRMSWCILFWQMMEYDAPRLTSWIPSRYVRGDFVEKQMSAQDPRNQFGFKALGSIKNLRHQPRML